MKIHNLILITAFAIIATIGFFFLSKVLGENSKKTEKEYLIKKFDSKESIFSTVYNNSSEFEGVVELIQKNLYDTVSYKLYVYKNKVKLDKNVGQGKAEESLIFDLKNEVITALNHEKKLYYNLPKKLYNSNIGKEYKIIKTSNVKNILGYKCIQWRVRNDVKNTEITFWVTGKKYNFYQRFLKLWNKTDNCFQYFLNIPEVEGYMPVQQVERTLLRDVKTTILINKISDQKVDTLLFNIPKDYSLFTK